jgi:hypothetical protein
LRKPQRAYKLDYKTVDAAVSQIIKHFGISVCDNSDQLVANSKYHTLNLSGLYLNELPVLIICQIGIEPKLGCVTKLRIKCENEVLSQNIIDSLQ